MNNSISYIKVKLSQVRLMSLMEIRAFLLQKINIEEFNRDDRKIIKDICMIMAEVLKLSPKAEIRIGKEQLPAEMVQEIYLMIDERHIWNVLEKFKKIDYVINAKKTYIRTAVYNSFFELELNEENNFNAGEF